jgi:quercetin dioxygenase-like cupin family protein
MSFFVRGPGEGAAYEFGGARFTIKAGGCDTEGRVGVMEQCGPPGLSVPAHVHEGEDEMFYVLAGRLQGWCGDREWSAAAGSFLFLPRDVEHGFQVIGDEPARALTIVGPARVDELVATQGEPVGG